jgi:DNA replication protein DnaC
MSKPRRLDELLQTTAAQLAEARARSFEWEHTRLAPPDERTPEQREREDLALRGIPERYLRLEIDEGRIPAPLREWAATWPNGLSGGGSVLLAGPPGTGKSIAGAWLVREANRKLGPVGDARRMRAADLFAAVFEKDAKLLQRARSATLLVVDDWGLPHETSWPESEMDSLIDGRWEACLTTVVTTNLRPTRSTGAEVSFEARYPRVWSRLLDSSGPGLILVTGKDARR